MINYHAHAAEEKAKQAVHEVQSSASSSIHEAAQTIAAKEAAIMARAEKLHEERLAEICRQSAIDRETRDKQWAEKEAANLQLSRGPIGESLNNWKVSAFRPERPWPPKS